jgi:hypothetical protein
MKAARVFKWCSHDRWRRGSEAADLPSGAPVLGGRNHSRVGFVRSDGGSNADALGSGSGDVVIIGLLSVGSTDGSLCVKMQTQTNEYQKNTKFTYNHPAMKEHGDGCS